MIDASIPLGAKGIQIESPVNQLATLLQIQGAQQSNQLNGMKMDEYRRGVTEDQQMRDLTRQSGGDTSKLRDLLYGAGNYKQGAAMDKAIAEQRKSAADMDKTNMETAAHRLDLAGQVFGHVRANPTLETANAALDYLGQNGIYKPEQVAQYKAQVAAAPQNIAQMADMAFRAAAKTKDQMLSFQTRNTGATTDTLSTDPISGATRVTNSVKNSVSPDAQLQANTSTANNQRTIAAENMRAGVGANGALDDNAERTAQAIAKGQLPAPTGMALLNPKNQRVLGRVMEINPDYDSTSVEAKKKAAKDFGSGSQGNAMRSFAVAGNHLDQLGTLVDALDNGNMQVVNKVGQYIASQTGSPAPTNFDAAKDVVSKEVIKAIVGGGGGVAERQELSNLMSKANSPAQLKGVIQQYRTLMSAQHDALLTQRRAAGLTDSTLPNYNAVEVPQTSTPSAIPSGWSVKAH